MPTPAPSDEQILGAARATVRREAAAVAGLGEQLDAGFASLVREVLALEGKLVTTGAGTSGIMAERMAHLLAVSGTPAFYLPCLDALHGGMGAVQAGDLVIALSKGGRSEEMVRLAERLVSRGIRVIAVTEQPGSPFAAAASAVVTIRTEPSDADPGGLIAMGSTLVAGSWGDALAETLMRLREFAWDEVVDVHPAGVVGLQTELPERLTLDGGAE